MYQHMVFTHSCSSNITAMVLESYYRFEAWVEDLPRVKYAIAVGLASFFGVFVGSLLLQGLTTVHAVMMGVTMVIVYYGLDPR